MIEKGKKPGTQKVLVHSSSDKLNKKGAIKSLGKKASRYVVKTFKLDGAKDKKKKS